MRVIFVSLMIVLSFLSASAFAETAPANEEGKKHEHKQEHKHHGHKHHHEDKKEDAKEVK